MSNEITSVAAKGHQLAALQSAAPAVAKVAAPAQQAEPQRPQIQFDPAQMRQELQQALERLNEQAQRNQASLSFSRDEVANRNVVTVTNTQTGEVIRRIPNEVVLKVAHNIEQVKGMLHNEVI